MTAERTTANPTVGLWAKRNTATVGIPLNGRVMRRLGRVDARKDRKGQ